MENQIKKISVYGDSILKGAVTGTSSGHLFDIIDNDSLKLAGKTLGIEISNQSVFGSTIVKTQKRLNRDIERETAGELAIIESGGNDCDYDWTYICENNLTDYGPRVPLSDFIRITDEMVKSCRAEKITPLVMTMPALVPDRWFNHICKNHGAEKIKAFVKNIPDVLYRNHEMYNLHLLKYCYEHNAQFVDMRLAFLEHSNYRDLMCLDGIHPNEDGHAFMAHIWETELPRVKKEF